MTDTETPNQQAAKTASAAVGHDSLRSPGAALMSSVAKVKVAVGVLMLTLVAGVLLQVSGSAAVGAQAEDGVLFRAQVEDEANRPEADLIVLATIVPSEEELKKTEGTDQSLNQFDVGQATTSQSGAFSLYLDAASVPRQYLQDDGSISLRLRFMREPVDPEKENRLGSYAISLHPPPGGKGPWRSTQVEDDTARPGNARSLALKFILSGDGSIQADETADNETLELSLDAASPEPNNRSSEDGLREENQFGTCYENWQINYFRPIVLMSGGSNSNKVQIDYKYVKNDSHTVGVGFSLTGAFGSFSASGELTTSTQVTINWAPRTAASGNNRVYFRSKIKYSKYRTVCYIGGIEVYDDYEVRPRYVTGDNILSNQSTIYNTYCTQLTPGGGVTKTSGQTVNFTNGVDISSKIGIDLRAKNKLVGGASHQVEFKNLSTSKIKYVCGKYRLIGSTSPTGSLMGDWKDR